MRSRTSAYIIAASIGLQACGGGGSSSSPSQYEQYQAASDPAAMLTKKCAAEAGIPANDPKHVITPAEMRAMTDCVDRNR